MDGFFDKNTLRASRRFERKHCGGSDGAIGTAQLNKREEGRTDLGNTRPGDGKRFKGRGPIQLTGRSNYRAAGRALELPLENNPKRVSRPSVGFRTSAWFWNSRGLNKYADQGNFREVTRRINGGYNGYEDRLKYYRRALQVL